MSRARLHRLTHALSLAPGIRGFVESRAISRWHARGSPLPPPHPVKRHAVLETARTFSLGTLVETGTFRGDMVAAMRPFFGRIVSIELSATLAAAARRRFAGSPQIEIIEGDSAAALRTVVATLDRPALFWLDGHYSGPGTARGEGDTPVIAELETIYASRQGCGAAALPHAVLIDDARLFGTDPAYPTIEGLRRLLATLAGGIGFVREVEVADDIIRLLPATASGGGLRPLLLTR